MAWSIRSAEAFSNLKNPLESIETGFHESLFSKADAGKMGQ